MYTTPLEKGCGLSLALLKVLSRSPTGNTDTETEFANSGNPNCRDVTQFHNKFRTLKSTEFSEMGYILQVVGSHSETEAPPPFLLKISNATAAWVNHGKLASSWQQLPGI